MLVIGALKVEVKIQSQLTMVPWLDILASIKVTVWGAGPSTPVLVLVKTAVTSDTAIVFVAVSVQHKSGLSIFRVTV